VDERLDPVVLRALAREPAERYQDARAFKQDVVAALATAGESARGASRGNAVPAAPPRTSAWPSVRFHIPNPNSGEVAVRGLLHRDDDALVIEFEFAKKNAWKKFKEFFQEPTGPHEVRIALQQIASLTYGWGWGRPPRSLILKAARLSALAGVPGSKQGQVKLYVQREDRPAARRLVESIMGATAAGAGPDPARPVYDREQARLEVATPAVGLFLTGLVTLLSWFWIVLFLILERFEAQSEVRYWVPSTVFWLGLILVGSLIVPVSAVIMTGAVMMRQLRWYPLAATSAILAMVPWSLGWLIGLGSGIWTCIILGRPGVVEAFLGDQGRAQDAPAAPPKPGGALAGRFRSLLRSMGRYMLPTFPGARSAAGAAPAGRPSIEAPVAQPTVDYPDAPSPPAAR
jgi:hypothetical protein